MFIIFHLSHKNFLFYVLVYRIIFEIHLITIVSTRIHRNIKMYVYGFVENYKNMEKHFLYILWYFLMSRTVARFSHII